MNLRQLLHKLLHITATTLFLHDKNTPVRDAVMDFGAKRFDFIRSRLFTMTSQTTRPNISTTYQTTHFCVVPEIQEETRMASAHVRRRRLRRNSIISHVFDVTMATFGTAFIALLITWLMINWITGCGEVTRTIDGKIIQGECVLVPWRS